MKNIKLFTFICDENTYNKIEVNDDLTLKDGTIVKVMYKYFNPKSLQYIVYGKVVKEGVKL